jgi:hypothetical protein
MTRIRRTSLLRVAVLLAALSLTACTAASTSAPPTVAPVATTAPSKPAPAAVSAAAGLTRLRSKPGRRRAASNSWQGARGQEDRTGPVHAQQPVLRQLA